MVARTITQYKFFSKVVDIGTDAFKWYQVPKFSNANKLAHDFVSIYSLSKGFDHVSIATTSMLLISTFYEKPN